MSKACSVCSLPADVQSKVVHFHDLGASQQKIVKIIQEQFSLAVSASALNRHFNHCTSNCTPTGSGNLELSSLRKKLCLPVMTGEEIYKVQCRIFAEEMECFARKMAQKEPTDMSLDDLKCLDVLMSMRVKLYPKESQENKLQMWVFEKLETLQAERDNLLLELQELKGLQQEQKADTAHEN